MMKYDEDVATKCCDILKQWSTMFDNSTCILLLLSDVDASAEVKTQVAIQIFIRYIYWAV